MGHRKSAHSRAMQRLQTNLEREGYESYEEYLHSAHWYSVKAAYRASSRPQTCPCGETRVDLHHRTYRRLGREALADLIPLCRDHHYDVHKRATKYSHVGLTAETARTMKALGPSP